MIDYNAQFSSLFVTYILPVYSFQKMEIVATTIVISL